VKLRSNFLRGIEGPSPRFQTEVPTILAPSRTIRVPKCYNNIMSIKAFYSTVGAVFFLIFILHLARIIFGWDAVIGGVAIPMWVSWIAAAVAAFLLYQGYKFKKQL